ncbi:binding-protein-dependent transport systems inner membrane component [Thermobaculum terrenum ATCC BAA-798]|uniref:Binding-protein-dependent transport systems inner membrane component n=1 Tax=Thermobaculum terrenum (strain ATCC BAA-798 / CCMEE 7001 / YNP1) TaxID=525904 RepID=D1CGQ7_THET1|nr:sugar ABC transporter permease [Thermobaculum terrenum]ACZ42928.1 binding-protein-dependent transport systems inner membrane component [Thermobaculum terrenum ATCC BAA-798]
MAATTYHTSWWRRNERKIAPYLFIAPFWILFLVFGLYPIVYSLYLSFFKGFGFEEKTFFGLGNYIHLFQDERYIKAVINTTYFAAGSVFILSPLALILALVVNSRLVPGQLKSFYKAMLFFPVITSAVVIAIIFARVLDQQYGLLNALLRWFGLGPYGWLTDPKFVMPSFIIMAIWTYLGINMLYWIAGLTGISRELYEAAYTDGANKWQAFWHITLPLLRPVTLFVVIQAIVGSYNLFAQPLLLTNGGPSDASLTITLYLYNQGFVYFNVGYASAIAYSMVVILLILSLLNIYLFRGYSTEA